MADKTYRILALNPGSTSTKIGVFENETCVAETVARHPRDELEAITSDDGDVQSQKAYRLEVLYELLEKENILLDSLDAVVGCAGRLPPMASGTYVITDELLSDVPYPLVHAALLGSIMAREIGDRLGIPAFTVDPNSVDELSPEARLTGIPGFERTTIVHALNQRAMARRCARHLGLDYRAGRFVVAHMGGGITVGAHLDGRIVDVNNASNGEGPFSPERAGAVPVLPLLDLCFDGAHGKADVYKYFRKSGGLAAHLGTSDLRECEAMADSGDAKADLVIRSMAYKVAREIGAICAVLGGRPDAIVLTGGLAHSKRVTGLVLERVRSMAPVYVYPGEDELLALTQGALRVLRGDEQPVEYIALRNRPAPGEYSTRVS